MKVGDGLGEKLAQQPITINGRACGLSLQAVHTAETVKRMQIVVNEAFQGSF
jgi:hypothetical protein